MNMNIKHVLIDSNVLCLKALRLYEDFRKRSPKPMTPQVRLGYRSGIGLNQNISKLLEGLCLLMKKLLPQFRQN